MEKMEKLGQQDLFSGMREAVSNENLRAIDSNMQAEKLNSEDAASFRS